MFKYIVFLLLNIAFVSSAAFAQKDSLTARREQIRKTLNMSVEQYKGYRESFRLFGQRLVAVRQNSQLTDSAKTAAIKQLHVEISEWQQQHLTSDQISRLRAFEMNDPKLQRLPHRQRVKDMEERLHKREKPQPRDTTLH